MKKIALLSIVLFLASCSTHRAPVVEKIARDRIVQVPTPADTARVTIRIVPTPEGGIEIRDIDQATTPRAKVRVESDGKSLTFTAIVDADSIPVAVTDTLISSTPAPPSATDRFFEKFDATLWLIVIVLALILIMRVLTLTKQ